VSSGTIGGLLPAVSGWRSCIGAAIGRDTPLQDGPARSQVIVRLAMAEVVGVGGALIALLALFLPAA
jgi:hypothetical protein